MKFELSAVEGRARRGQLQFERGNVDTPAFMPVGTNGTVKSLTPEEVAGTGAQIDRSGQHLSFDVATGNGSHQGTR